MSPFDVIIEYLMLISVHQCPKTPNGHSGFQLANEFYKDNLF